MQLPADRDAVAVGEPYVEHRDVRAQRRAAREGVLDSARVADDRDVRFGVEQVGQTPSYDLVVVQQEHTDGVLFVEGVCLGHDDPSFPDDGRTADCP